MASSGEALHLRDLLIVVQHRNYSVGWNPAARQWSSSIRSITSEKSAARLAWLSARSCCSLAASRNSFCSRFCSRLSVQIAS